LGKFIFTGVLAIKTKSFTKTNSHLIAISVVI